MAIDTGGSDGCVDRCLDLILGRWSQCTGGGLGGRSTEGVEAVDEDGGRPGESLGHGATRFHEDGGDGHVGTSRGHFVRPIDDQIGVGAVGGVLDLDDHRSLRGGQATVK